MKQEEVNLGDPLISNIQVSADKSFILPCKSLYYTSHQFFSTLAITMWLYAAFTILNSGQNRLI